MNKNKLIFAIIGAVIFLLIIFLIISTKNNTKGQTVTNNGDFNIWIVGDNKAEFTKIITEFKNLLPKYKNNKINVESFNDYEEYLYSLSSAISQDQAPDIFVLNNNEKSPILGSQIIALNPSIFNTNDFRKNFKGVFSDDLIVTYQDGEKEKEALAGIPVGYETLGIFYNGLFVKDKEIKYISGLNSKIFDLKKSKPNYTPIGIGNGSTVFGASDIITQFFMLESQVNKIGDISGNKLKEALGTYLYYGDKNSDNAYNSKFVELKTLGKNNLDLFAKGEIYMVVGYPRLINKIDENGYSKNLLRASVFPHYLSGEGKTLLNYNYFVINKDTKNYDLSNDFLAYLASETGAQSYLDKYPYYLPSLLSLEADKLEEKINKDYKSVILRDFYNSDYTLSSFDKGIKTIYDRDIISILDNSSNYESQFLKFKKKLICQSKKIVSLENLSTDCK